MKASTLVDRATIALQEEAHVQWRDWVCFLQAHLILIQPDEDESHAFERDDTRERERMQAQDNLKRIPLERKRFFERVITDARDLQARQTPIMEQRDPDTLERHIYTFLLREAHGYSSDSPDSSPSDWGSVPFPADGGIHWIEVNIVGLHTTDVAYTVRPAHATDEADMRRRYLLSGVLVIGLIVFLCIWFGIGRGASSPHDRPLLRVNNTPVSVWPIRAVIVDQGGAETALPIMETKHRWPPVSQGQAQGFWYSSSVAPTYLCLPALALEDATITLVGSGDIPRRVYQRVTPATADPDLVVSLCADQERVWYGTLQAISAPERAEIGQSRALADGRLVTVTAIDLVGVGEDPTIPQGQARVFVRVAGAIRDWHAYAPILLSANGERQSPLHMPLTDDREETTLAYLIAAPSQPLPLMWRITSPDAQVLQWYTVLPPPPDRDTVVRTALETDAVSAIWQDGTMLITTTLRNRRTTPVSLTRTDFLFQHEGRDLPFVEPHNLSAGLAPATQRALAFQIARAYAQSPITMGIGPMRYTLTWSMP